MQPLLFQPLFKRIRWGGRRLGTVLGKPIGPESDYAESWEVSDHGADQSIVINGGYAGTPLAALVKRQNLPLFGSHAGLSQFPLLVKYLDANEPLSVQVHPDDQLVKNFAPHENGKTEAWVIIDAIPESKLFVGFLQGVTESDVRRAVTNGNVEQLLHSIHVQAGDCVFVPAGTVHAVGAGVLLAEIQQSSDVTFRLFDWNRRGPDGQLRELHVEQALSCIDFTRGPVDPVTPRKVTAAPLGDVVELVNSDYFVMQQIRTGAPCRFDPHDELCHVLMMLGGSGRLVTHDEEILLPLGQTVLLPAERGEVEIIPDGQMTLLNAFLPPAQS